MTKDTGKVLIHGKEYSTVASRVQTFREANEEFGIETEIVSVDETTVIMKAYIKDETGRIIATGHAEENRASSQINRTSALENAETSAIGRALAAFGLAGTEFASADEVAGAIKAQKASPKPTHELPPASEKQRALIRTKLHAIGVSDEDSPGYLIETYGVTVPLDIEQATFVIGELLDDDNRTS